jgi:hypothetical protein
VGGVHIIQAKDSVGRCGQEGTFDLTSLAVHARNVTVCAGSLIYELDAWDSGFEYVTRSGTELTFVFKPTAEYGKSYRIRYKVRCPGKELGAYGELLILVKDVCYDVDCDGNQVCDECTATCVDAPVDITTN